MSTQALSLRLTSKYVGSYQHLDDWQTIGSVTTILSNTFDGNEEAAARGEEGDDITEPKRTVMLVCVACEEPQPLQTIENALRNSFSSQGCAHEYDCCGCRSFWVRKAEHLSDSRWQLEIGSSRNY